MSIFLIFFQKLLQNLFVRSLPNPHLEFNDTNHQSYLQCGLHLPRNKLGQLDLMISLNSFLYCHSIITKFWYSFITKILSHYKDFWIGINCLSWLMLMLGQHQIFSAISVPWLTLSLLNTNCILYFFLAFLSFLDINNHFYLSQSI